jgi:hypothetical protein
VCVRELWTLLNKFSFWHKKTINGRDREGKGLKKVCYLYSIYLKISVIDVTKHNYYERDGVFWKIYVNYSINENSLKNQIK